MLKVIIDLNTSSVVILNSMNTKLQNSIDFSEICIEQCGGNCCDPWWGIITYPMVKSNGLSNLSGFRTQVLKGIREREQRIVNAYITRDEKQRKIFDRPDRYNIRMTDIHVEGTTLKLVIMAMFGFKCSYLSEEKRCTIHPAILGGPDLRPQQCAELGGPDAQPGEKGYCRIIHAYVESGNGDTVKKAIQMEKQTSAIHFQDGVVTADLAADRVIEQLKRYGEANLRHLLPNERIKKQGRNDPCACGSGQKFKKCCGRVNIGHQRP
jgi:Fe-S-cluster containining protein